MLNLTAFRATLGALAILLGTPALAQSPQGEPAKPDIDLYAHMSGNCRKLKVAGHDFACDAGDLTKARLLEPYGMVWINQALVQGKGRNWAFAAVKP